MTERESIQKFLREKPGAVAEIGEMLSKGVFSTFDQITEEDKKQPLVVVGAGSTDVTGAKQYRCKTCNGIIWLSPSTQDMVAKHIGEVVPTCMKCVLTMLKEFVQHVH